MWQCEVNECKISACYIDDDWSLRALQLLRLCVPVTIVLHHSEIVLTLLATLEHDSLYTAFEYDQ